MPELPEVESARTVIERAALGRCITTVDDSDSYVCRPHPPGQIRDALVGRRLVTACRIGKALWCATSPVDGSAAEGPPLGIHLGMSGEIIIADADGTEIDGGDHWDGRRAQGDYRWSRFRLTFDDGGMLMLVDPRRLGRIRLDPPLGLGLDAATITDEQFRAAIAHGITPIKARLSTSGPWPGSGTCSPTRSSGAPRSTPPAESTISVLPSGTGCSTRSGRLSATPCGWAACTRSPSSPTAGPAADARTTAPPSEYWRLVKELRRDRLLQSTSTTGNDH